MKKITNAKHILVYTSVICLVAVILILVISSVGYRTDEPFLDNVTFINHASVSVNGEPCREVELPHSFENLEPRTPVTVQALIKPKPEEVAYVKSIYAPARIYANGNLVYQFGMREKYPGFMKDPGKEVHLIELDGYGETVSLRMEYLSPATTDTLRVDAPVVGISKDMIFNIFHRHGVSLILAIMQLLGGIALILIFICVRFIDKKAVIFLWLGLFSFATGLWAFGSNGFIIASIKNPTLVYIITYAGMFTFILPLLQFTKSIIDFEKPAFIINLEIFFAISAIIAMALQLAGKVPLNQSMYFFHAALPIAVAALALITIGEFIKYRNLNARNFMLPLTLLAFSAVMDFFSFGIPSAFTFSSIFQIGSVMFLLIMGITASIFIKDSIDIKNKAKELAFEKGIVDIQIKEQKERGLLLAHKEEMLRQQRHDLKHHLTAIQELANPENTELNKYLQTLSDRLPVSSANFCENRTVNAVISHYENICKLNNIELSLKLAVPPCKDGISDSELCIIFGNLLENAVEACERMTKGKRFIKLNSSLQFDLITVTMDNSFDGSISRENGRFRSSKRDDFGIGLESVKSVAEKYGGDVEFRTDGNVFLSSVYFRIN